MTVHLCTRKEFPGGVVAVRDVNLEVERGELVVLVDPSGRGKSTVLRMVAGLEAVTAGEVRIAGRVVTGLPPQHRNVAMVFQNYALYAHMTVRANMGFGLKMAGMPKREICTRVEPSSGHPWHHRAAGPYAASVPRGPASARGHGTGHRP